jgi:hypothetical protein
MELERATDDRPSAIKLVDRPGKRGQNSERFSIDLDFNPVRTRLLEAARRKLSESVTLTCNTGSDPHIQIDVTEPESSPSAGDWLSEESLEEIRNMWAAAESDQEREVIQKVVPINVLRISIAA